MSKGHWFIFVLYKPTEDGKQITAKLVQYWARSETAAVKRVGKVYPDHSQWFMIQTGWWKALASLFTFSKIVRWK